jgi:autotransporter family porin
MGGWQTDPTAVGPTFGLPAAGVILNSAGGTATMTNGGSIGALSDLAVATGPQINPLINPPVSSSPTSIINNGTITGFVQLGSGDNSIFNNGTFDLRDFADTNGDGVRDTVRVVTADFGSGPSNSFTNNGTLALAALPTTPTPKIDSTGEYLPLGNPNNTMALGGPLQGQIIGVSTFTNSGTINLQANPVPGDVLMITGGRGGSSPGTGGGGTYVSNGGTLMLDTVLNEGGAATHSDTLVVDGTSVGSKGATKIDILNAGGDGAFTGLSDGILVVQVLDPTQSRGQKYLKIAIF